MRGLLLALLSFVCCGASAATFTVTRFDDPLPGPCLASDCSLREAANAASAAPDVDTIVLSAGTYNLTRTDPTPGSVEPEHGAVLINLGDVSIVGAGSALTRVRWNVAWAHTDGVFLFRRDATAVLDGPQLIGMSISDGTSGCVRAMSISTAIRAFAIEDVVVENCQGAAFSAYHVNLEMTDTTIRDNGGTGLSLDGSVTVLTTNVHIRNNARGVSIAGSVLGYLSNVDWVDDGRSKIEDNQASGDGGGILVGSFASLQLATVSTAPVGQRMSISNNTASGNGGGVYLQGHAPFEQNSLERVVIAGNRAANGGGVAAGLRVHVVDSEIAGNSATSGDGGGVWFFLNGTEARAVRQVALRGNVAAGGGGAISHDCGNVAVENVSMDGNNAANGRGQAIETLGNIDLRHATVRGNGTHGATPGVRKTYSTACAGKQLRIANSLITERCASTVAGEIVSQGGNQYGVAAGTCPALQSDRRQSDDNVFGLRLGAYNGPFTVWGWSLGLAIKPQRNFGLTANCTTVDVRGVARSDGRCDAGAFEQ